MVRHVDLIHASIVDNAASTDLPSENTGDETPCVVLKNQHHSTSDYRSLLHSLCCCYYDFHSLFFAFICLFFIVPTTHLMRRFCC